MNGEFVDKQSLDKLTERIIGCAYQVSNRLGIGFVEKVYENALMFDFEKEGISANSQSPIKVLYKNKIVGEYFADILVDEKIIIEIKASKILAAEHEAQLLNYLKATNIEVGLLLNFGPKPEIKRRATSNKNKPYLQSKKS